MGLLARPGPLARPSLSALVHMSQHAIVRIPNLECERMQRGCLKIEHVVPCPIFLKSKDRWNVNSALTCSVRLLVSQTCGENS